MMFNYPYIGYPPYNNYYKYFNNSKSNPWNMNQTNNYKASNIDKNNNNAELIEEANIDNRNNNSKSYNNKKSNSEYIDILGIRLYFDDILLILLIYFLYSEGVKDTGLFITLILLLLG